jgi:hypothetical protein
MPTYSCIIVVPYCDVRILKFMFKNGLVNEHSCALGHTLYKNFLNFQFNLYVKVVWRL